jgi:ankyrin repeat protein
MVVRWIRNAILLGLIAAAFSGLALADYYLRHEETGRTRRWLLGQGYTPDADAVLRAVNLGDREALEALSRLGLGLGEPGTTGETPLTTAVRGGDAVMVDYLLSKPGGLQTLNHRGGDGQTALAVAIEGNHYALAEKLIEAGAVMEKGRSWIAGAVGNDDRELFQFLVRQGVAVGEKGANGLTPLVLAVEEEKNDWVVRLLEAGAEVDQAGASGEPLLLEAARRGRWDLATTLIEHGARVDGKNQAGETALMLAVEKGDREGMALLLGAGAKTDVPDARGQSVVDRLLAGGDVGLVEFFAAEKGGGITQDWMVRVFESGQVELLEGLLKKGGEVEAGRAGGGRLLKRAVLGKDRKMVELLLAFDADPKGEVWDALASGDQQILEQLLVAGADANEPLALGVGSPLSLALRQRRYASAETLLRHGADPNPRQEGGLSLVEEAEARGDGRAAALLRDYCGDYREEELRKVVYE